MRRRMIKELETMGLKYKTGEFIGEGEAQVTIEHNLGEVPLLLAFFSDEIGDETSGTFGGMLLNTGVATRYTSTVSKEWSEVGVSMVNDGTNVLANGSPSSKAYGVQSIDENMVDIVQYGNKQNFISGKVYHWIAIADWRS